MILQALTQYYQRKADSSQGSGIAPQGFENKQIPFVIVIDKDGGFVSLDDTRNSDKSTKKGEFFLVPLGESRSGKNSYKTTNILWDHYGYLLAHPKDIAGSAKMSDEAVAMEMQKSIEMANLQHQAFIEKVDSLHHSIPEDIGILAIQRFLANDNAIDDIKLDSKWADCQKIKGCNLTFRLKGQPELICQSKAIQSYLKNQLETPSKTEEGVEAICLVTGKNAPIARLHQPISGVNAKPSPFASINLDAFESYGKTQGYGFPVSEAAMFEYTTALNTLLKSNNRFRLGDVSVVCWSEKASKKEDEISFVLNGGQAKEDPDAYVDSVKKLFSSFHQGVYDEPDGEQVMYVLGLSPNSARIVVRFWQQSTIAALSTNIADWFHDIEMVRGHNSHNPKYMPLLRLLCHLVFEGKVENLPPNVVADVTKNILEGTPLPITILQLAIRRNRADQSVTYARAGLIKAYLNRKARLTASTNFKEISVGYDKDRTDTGYVLGALFAVLEKIQESKAFYDKVKIKSTIKDRYFGSASSTPIIAFATLIKLSQHHLSSIGKKSVGGKIELEKQLASIMEQIEMFPSHLNMEQQGLFAIGYYHRRQEFFATKKE